MRWYAPELMASIRAACDDCASSGDGVGDDTGLRLTGGGVLTLEGTRRVLLCDGSGGGSGMLDDGGGRGGAAGACGVSMGGSGGGSGM